MNVELYCCYSLNLRKYLQNNGVNYHLCGLNPNSHKMFWVFVKDEKLNNLLNTWTAKE